MRLSLVALSFAMLVPTGGTLAAQATLRPLASGRATSEVTLSYPRDSAPAGASPVSIKLDYGQPHLRGRAINTDSLVPFDTPWRTGANAATTLTTGVDLVIGGKPVPKGTYVLWTLPTRTSWELIIQRSLAPGTMQQAMQYDAAHDVARVVLTRTEIAVPLESLTMWVIPSLEPGHAHGELRLSWGNTQLSTSWAVR